MIYRQTTWAVQVKFLTAHTRARTMGKLTEDCGEFWSNIHLPSEAEHSQHAKLSLQLL